MSKSLVNRLLHLTSEDVHYSSDKKLENYKQKKRTRVRYCSKLSQTQEAPVEVASERDIMAWHVASILNLDETMEDPPSKPYSSNKKKNHAKETLRRIEKQHSSATKRRKVSSQNMIGNSRTSSTQYRQPTLNKKIPTFNKKKYQEEQEVKRLQHIAKLLNKKSKKSKK